MADFNPHQPQILGQEFVPIRNEITEFSPVVNAVEYGTALTTRIDYALTEGRFYTNDWMNQPLPLTSVSYQTIAMSIYPAGFEGVSGPVERIVIPVSNGGVTGANTSMSASTMAASVYNPGQPGGVTWSLGSATGTAAMYFNMQPYLNALSGKRILGVNILYGARYNPSTTNDFNPTLTWAIAPALNTGLIQRYVYSDWTRFDSNANTLEQFETFRLKLGEINPYHGGTPGSGVLFPWTVGELNRFDFSQVNPIGVLLTGAITSPASFVLTYVAMEIIYCEEQRLFYGATQSNVNGYGQVALSMRTITGALSGTLSAGNYTLAISAPDRGDGGGGSTLVTPFPPVGPKLNALRELYSVPQMLGYKINLPFPVDDSIVGQEFSVETTPLHTQTALFDVTGPVHETMSYGRQAAAEVWGTVTARQTIQDYTLNSFLTPAGAASYPYVRFYARRFGNTQVPLKIQSSAPSISGFSNTAMLTPDQFDALEPEGGIIDGWKEVTLQFDSAPTMGTGIWPEWYWSAAGEEAGNRWEILGATAPDISGGPGNLLLPSTPSSSRGLYRTTYGSPPTVSGGTVNMSWVPYWNPPTSSIVADVASDAVLMFSQYPPAITGLGITQLAYPVTGIGSECSDYNCCVPTSILYNKVEWSTPLPIVCDKFDRVTAGGLGTYLGGINWAISGVGADWSTDGSQAVYVPSGTTQQLVTLQNTSDMLQNSEVTVKVTISNLTTASSITIGLLAKYISANDFYLGTMDIVLATGLASVSISKTVSGAGTTLASSTTIPYKWTTADTTFYMKLQAYNRNIRFKVWQEYDEEPAAWQVQAVDSSLVNTTGTVGIRVRQSAGNTTYKFDNFLAVPTGLVGSVFELQRSDQVSDWATIMRASNLCTESFNDYEARVGLESSYRIRSLNVYEFEGQWSSTALGTIQSPGVSGGPCLNGSHALIFTSNFDQSGNSNLAYVEAYEGGRPEQAFGFPEANTLTLQRMYRRNFQVAFKGTERGGEAFTRMILVQAAAVSPPRLANMTSLRDMAWAALPYVAVRDDIGDRWLASVSVPSNKVWKRKIYLANIGVAEVTDTPYPVDP